MIREPTRVTETSTIIDHVYISHPDNIIESFVSPHSISMLHAKDKQQNIQIKARYY